MTRQPLRLWTFGYGKAIAWSSGRCLIAVSYPLVTALEKNSNTFAGVNLCGKCFSSFWSQRRRC